MKHIFLFESYISQVYEIQYSEHWENRTSLNHPDSRVVKNSENQIFGFLIESFIDSSGKNHTLSEIVEALNTDEKNIYKYIEFTLNKLTNSQRLTKWFPENPKRYHLLDLGRIGFYREKEYIVYPIIKAGKKSTSEFYGGGDKIWGVAKPKTDEDIDLTNGITIKYYMSDESGKDEAYNDMLNNEKINTNYFINNFSFEFPYGKDFTTYVDLSLETEEDIYKKITSKIEGTPFVPTPPKNYDVSKEIEAKPLKSLKLLKGSIISILDNENKESIYQIDGEILDKKHLNTIYDLYTKDTKNNEILRKEINIAVYPIKSTDRDDGGKDYSIQGERLFIKLIPGQKISVKKNVEEPYTNPYIIYNFKNIGFNNNGLPKLTLKQKSVNNKPDQTENTNKPDQTENTNTPVQAENNIIY